MANPVIQTKDLTKVYKSRTEWEFSATKPPKRKRTAETRALQMLNLNVEKGEIFGYLGPNGAGKTTTIRLLLDLIRPTQGSASVLGMDINRQSVELHRHVGFLPGELSLWKNRTGQQVAHYVAEVRGGDVGTNALREAERLDLDMSKKVHDYSSGNRRKLGLVIALMHHPEVLILDEPTNGLDPLVQQTFHQIVREARDEGRTIFLSSHVLSEVQAICDRVGILRDGELKAVERVADLMRTDFRWVTVTARESIDPSTLNGVAGVSDVHADNGSLKLRLMGDFDPLMRALSKYYIVDLVTAEPTLEEIFLTFYGGNNGRKGKEA